MGHSILRASLILTVLYSTAWSQTPTKMSYQGVLTDASGAPVADGSHSLVFKLYNVSTGGAALWTETQGSVNTTNGVLSVLLGSVTPIGIAFDGALWLGIAVDGGGELTPRIELTTSPYSFQAKSVDDDAVTSAKISDGTITSADIADETVASADILDGSITAADVAATEVVKSVNALTDAVTLAGGTNMTITPAGNTLTFDAAVTMGNTLDQAYDQGGGGLGRTITADAGAVDIAGTDGLQVTNGSVLFTGTTGTIPATGAGTRMMWYPAKAAFRAGKVVGTEWDDANIGASSTITGGEDNAASGAHATVSGGNNNAASGQFATVSGGDGSLAGGDNSVVGGGRNNTATATDATIAGGGGGTGNRATDDYGSVGGGANNQAGDNAGTTADRAYATVAGGFGNTAGGQSSTVGGGVGNVISNSGTSATIGGGNSNAASGAHATVPGGNSNTAAGLYSFAAGRRAKANHGGTFVWGDQTDADFASTAVDQFLIRATGGVGIGTASPAAGQELHVSGDIRLDDGANDNTISGGIAGIGSINLRDNVTGGMTFEHTESYQWSLGGTERMRLVNAGNLGIGTTTPRALLDIVKGTTGTGQILEVGSLSFYKDATPTRAADIGLSPVGAALTDDLIFSLYNGLWFERMRIANGGNVGIGTTSPQQLLDLHNTGSAGTVYPLRLINNTTATAGTGVGIEFGFLAGAQILSTIEAVHTGGSQTDLTFSTQNGAVNENMRILGSGNVGIGTTSPDNRLDIVGDANGAIRISNTDADATAKSLNIIGAQNTNADGAWRLIGGSANGTDNLADIGGGWSGYDAASIIRFYTAAAINTDTGTERMRIAGNGNVGIGTTSPLALFHVVVEI